MATAVVTATAMAMTTTMATTPTRTTTMATVGMAIATMATTTMATLRSTLAGDAGASVAEAVDDVRLLGAGGRGGAGTASASFVGAETR
jgi:hypothetical protein